MTLVPNDLWLNQALALWLNQALALGLAPALVLLRHTDSLALALGRTRDVTRCRGRRTYTAWERIKGNKGIRG